MSKLKCECSDPSCKNAANHNGAIKESHRMQTTECGSRDRVRFYYRVDLERIGLDNRGGVAFCRACANDAIASGVYA